MGRQIVRKRRRVFSLEPNKLVYIMFARNYAKNLMASLSKISPNHQNLQKVVKFEVDMAMALSASEFAWGHALKQKLLQKQENGNGNGRNSFDFSLQTLKFSREKEEEEEEDKKKMENGLVKLRKILPGGENNNDSNGDLLEEDDLLKQTESYIKCLELQVNVLRCLVDTNTD
ncbi:transcription factor bHLH146 [Momordica charantia]|uniref:Transcription factor bHLH146 n=1 Tax=Momordica charantia TaxID=3673 RepID=A0A6J1DIU0_MOMCH|nr:transcription factor bHLH146 [Momordica charantia]